MDFQKILKLASLILLIIPKLKEIFQTKEKPDETTPNELIKLEKDV